MFYVTRMAELILIRHGQSLWNLKNVFTGWVDVPLSQKGIEEALAAGEKLKDFHFDLVYVSTLVRAQMTAMLALSKNSKERVPILQHQGGISDEQKKQDLWSQIYSQEAKDEMIPVYAAWQLNERYYGELQGLNKKATAEKFGADQVHIWRRSYDVPPPQGEALKNTAERTIPFFKEVLVPFLQQGKNMLVSAHGNSLRSIVMHLDNLSQEQVLSLEIKTGDPIRYQMKDGNLTKVSF